MNRQLLIGEIEKQPYPLLFVTISGAHLYGFPSADSDYDLRGVHLLPVSEVIGLSEGRETIEMSGERSGVEIDFVTHDLKKFIRLMLKKNGYVLEQLFSPLVLLTTSAHAELTKLARGCITRHHAHHYLGFSKTQWELFEKERPRRIKPLLYTYRTLLTGVHLMQTGEIEANLVRLNESFRLPHVTDLTARKIEGREQASLDDREVDFHAGEWRRLTAMLEDAHAHSRLPERPSAREALSDFLVRCRVGSAVS